MPGENSHCADASQDQNAPIQSLEAWGPQGERPNVMVAAASPESTPPSR